jgi:sulfite reductase alpha subunit-like flavoprotein
LLWAVPLGALLQRGARVYVAGSADKMPADVAAAFRDVAAAQQGGLLVHQLQLGRLVEAWS